jgi:hypothetical protein
VPWLSDIITFGRHCTADRAWTQDRNLAGLYDGLIDARVADERKRLTLAGSNDRILLPDHQVTVPLLAVSAQIMIALNGDPLPLCREGLHR